MWIHQSVAIGPESGLLCHTPCREQPLLCGGVAALVISLDVSLTSLSTQSLLWGCWGAAMRQCLWKAYSQCLAPGECCVHGVYG